MQAFIIIKLFLFLNFCPVPNKLSKETQYHPDTSNCKPTRVSKEEYLSILKKELNKAGVLFDKILTPEKYSTLGYFKYMKSSGFYIYYEILIDSIGHVIKSNLKQNIYQHDKYPSQVKKKIAKINITSFNTQTVQPIFLLDYCYASDGSDDFIFVIKSGQLIEGSSSLSSINDLAENDFKKCYSKLVNNLYYSLLKYTP